MENDRLFKEEGDQLVTFLFVHNLKTHKLWAGTQSKLVSRREWMALIISNKQMVERVQKWANG
nr:hypothetical protein Itr_chr01CG16680 [Ipomoea trifida]